MIQNAQSLAQYAIDIIKEPVPAQKVALTRQANEAWFKGHLPLHDRHVHLKAPEYPGRPAKPELLSLRDMPRRRTGSQQGLIALIHSLVHIELNAIDMAFDLIARFCHIPLPRRFFDEAMRIGYEEAEHFEMINARLEELGAAYGDLPAHKGLWSAVLNTRHDLLARLAIVPMVLEARGLDVSPPMIKRVQAAGHKAVCETMTKIYQDEITHVAFGTKWFDFICKEQSLCPQNHFHELVTKYFRGSLKPPFNSRARNQAGLTDDFYIPLSEE